MKNNTRTIVTYNSNGTVDRANTAAKLGVCLLTSITSWAAATAWMRHQNYVDAKARADEMVLQDQVCELRYDLEEAYHDYDLEEAYHDMKNGKIPKDTQIEEHLDCAEKELRIFRRHRIAAKALSATGYLTGCYLIGKVYSRIFNAVDKNK